MQPFDPRSRDLIVQVVDDLRCGLAVWDQEGGTPTNRNRNGLRPLAFPVFLDCRNDVRSWFSPRDEMEYLQFEVELCELLKSNGWIESIKSNRQDTEIEWTPHGRTCSERFVDEVRALPRERSWSEEELAHLTAFGIYMGFVEASRRERTAKATRPFLESREVLVITTSPDNSRHTRFFGDQTFEDIYDYVESEQDAGREIMLISVDHILESNVGRAFPFGAADSPGVIWKRGEEATGGGWRKWFSGAQ